MTYVLLRDDFTGSGHLNGRTPDGANGGAWVAPAGAPGPVSPNSEVIGGGLLSETGDYLTNSNSACAPLAWSTSDMYVEARIIFGGSGGSVQGGSIGARWNPSDASGVTVGISPTGPTTVGLTIQDNQGMYLYTAANTAGNVTAGVVIRLEVQGTTVRTYVDSTEVLPAQTTHGTFTDRQAMLQILAPDSPSLGRTTSFDYFEAGSFVAPPSPPFWTRYQRCSETDS